MSLSVCSGIGLSVPVNVVRGTQVGSLAAVSYAGPAITTGTLQRVSAPSPTLVGGVAVVTGALTQGGDIVRFSLLLSVRVSLSVCVSVSLCLSLMSLTLSLSVSLSLCLSLLG